MATAWDTSVASQLHRGGRYHDLYSTRSVERSPFVITAPTVLETIYGWTRNASANSTHGAALAWYERFFDGPLARVLPVDAAASALAGGLRAWQPVPPTAARQDKRTRSDRRVAWVLDILIAATAWTAGYGIATRDRRDFEILRDLIAELHPDASPLVVADPLDG